MHKSNHCDGKPPPPLPFGSGGFFRSVGQGGVSQSQCACRASGADRPKALAKWRLNAKTSVRVSARSHAMRIGMAPLSKENFD